MILLSIEQVLQIHEYQLARFGGLPGIREMGLIESALQCVDNRIHYAKESDPVVLAGLYMHRIIQNHGFVDGNKRTGMHASLIFLRANGYDTSSDLFEALAWNAASGALEEETLAGFQQIFQENQ